MPTQEDPDSSKMWADMEFCEKKFSGSSAYNDGQHSVREVEVHYNKNRIAGVDLFHNNGQMFRKGFANTSTTWIRLDNGESLKDSKVVQGLFFTDWSSILRQRLTDPRKGSLIPLTKTRMLSRIKRYSRLLVPILWVLSKKSWERVLFLKQKNDSM